MTRDLPDDPAGELAKRGLLTERQAQAFMLRDVIGAPREDAAATMGITVNVLDKHLKAARDKVHAARHTLDALDEFQEIVDEAMRDQVDA